MRRCCFGVVDLAIAADHRKPCHTNSVSALVEKPHSFPSMPTSPGVLTLFKRCSSVIHCFKIRDQEEYLYNKKSNRCRGDTMGSHGHQPSSSASPNVLQMAPSTALLSHFSFHAPGHHVQNLKVLSCVMHEHKKSPWGLQCCGLSSDGWKCTLSAQHCMLQLPHSITPRAALMGTAGQLPSFCPHCPPKSSGKGQRGGNCCHPHEHHGPSSAAESCANRN